MTGAYVSLRRGIPTRPATPQQAAIVMKTYLTPIVCAIKPPAVGPTTGPEGSDFRKTLNGMKRNVPMRGPRLKMAIADARSCSENKSPDDQE